MEPVRDSLYLFMIGAGLNLFLFFSVLLPMKEVRKPLVFRWVLVYDLMLLGNALLQTYASAVWPSDPVTQLVLCSSLISFVLSVKNMVVMMTTLFSIALCMFPVFDGLGVHAQEFVYQTTGLTVSTIIVWSIVLALVLVLVIAYYYAERKQYALTLVEFCVAVVGAFLSLRILAIELKNPHDPVLHCVTADGTLYGDGQELCPFWWPAWQWSGFVVLPVLRFYLQQYRTKRAPSKPSDASVTVPLIKTGAKARSSPSPPPPPPPLSAVRLPTRLSLPIVYNTCPHCHQSHHDFAIHSCTVRE